MSNNSYDATGVLVFDGSPIVTSVIRALFDAFSLNEQYPGGDQCYIARDTDSTDTTWSAVRESIQEWAAMLGVGLTDEREDQEPGQILCALGKKLGISSPEFDGLVREVVEPDECQEADLNVLFRLASILNDGHNLLAIQYEGSWSSSKSRLGEFGGEGEYLSRHLRLYSSSTRAVQLGEDIDRHLRGDDVASAAQAMLKSVRRFLDSVLHDDQRAEITSSIAAALASGQDLQSA
ncbi:hypothetical protein [Paraburkholderia humisilvae]|uniref:Uncharacterized protein n=1 Tax=Paraburkholderia humisilvae TaxID=627669 RepID=A0A6J5DJC8_9BURK|nr:hypothetical protein [Paraburkholderia humisilvae]CAB3754350.1 hypothetical protein LMG29542_02324 [Paraburkholderia humisilvae]